MHYEKFIEEILNEAQVDQLSEPEKNEFRLRIKKAIEDRILVNVLGSLGEQEQEELKIRLDNEEEILDILNYIMDVKPELMQIVDKSVKDVRNELLGQ